MSFLLAIIVVIINLLSVISVLYGYEREKEVLLVIGILIYMATISVLGAFAIKIDNIEPIEVYRGNTELQITYQDSVPIDSIVVYKNK